MLFAATALPPPHRLLLLLSLLSHIGPTVEAACAFDVKGSYGDTALVGQYAELVGLACSGKCYKEASRWSLMALVRAWHTHICTRQAPTHQTPAFAPYTAQL